MTTAFCLPDPLLSGGTVCCHEKNLHGLHAAAYTGRSLRSGFSPDLGKPIERWGRKVTGLTVHRKVFPWQPDRQTGVRLRSFVASLDRFTECP